MLLRRFDKFPKSNRISGQIVNQFKIFSLRFIVWMSFVNFSVVIIYPNQICLEWISGIGVELLEKKRRQYTVLKHVFIVDLLTYLP